MEYRWLLRIQARSREILKAAMRQFGGNSGISNQTR
jgi:hypothetical protein